MATPQAMIPAAQYLRASTDHQQYSIQNQSEMIAEYALKHGFTIVATYQDAGRSGLTLRQRSGLSRLLKDVVQLPPFRTVLVYDVSRWGRFQDVDESAHYEFICKSAGVPICYCAELFANDGSMSSLILKGLKRAMAAEFSRELGEKVMRGQVNLARLGYKMGGSASYGLRRMLTGADGTHKQLLEKGDRKSLDSDRVVYIPGPAHEVETVRLIFRLALERGYRTKRITRYLNDLGIRFAGGKPWICATVNNLLRNPKYVGCSVWGRSSSRLHTRVRRTPKSEWVVKENVFAPIIDGTTFEKVQILISKRRWTDKQILDGLREVWQREGSVTQDVLSRISYGPRYATCAQRFGSLRHALSLVGYHHQRDHRLAAKHTRQRQTIQRETVLRLVEMFPRRISVERKRDSRHLGLVVDGRMHISIVIAPSRRTSASQSSWTITPCEDERQNLTLCCFLNQQNSKIERMYLVSRFEDAPRKLSVRSESSWFDRATKLATLRVFFPAVDALGVTA